ncbi:GTP-binding protein [Synechococcus sp. JA-2-3B'a(2-13)]|uniref:GTPase HflX n=1 Tax=Synechococcus sp. (strain JA-2-3B'a(2-13)) TaxID=321332 RepID=UPI0000694AE1|nr:GTPase HflX [Synechococcus sp. JA-2-3B'a(2-13)]ABD01378.1 GTP-binding protein [Synechococcus sp. JA-2-3B'a(2-13)]
MPRASTSRHQTDPRFSSAIAPRRFPEQAKGLKPHQQKQLQRLYQLRLPPDRLVTVEFAQRLGSLTQDLEGQPISVYLNRRGQVIRVGVGSPFETQIPAWELPRQGAERLSGIRCITTQMGEGGPGQKALTAMALQRLDALITLSVSKSGGHRRRGGAATGFVHRAYLAHLLPEGERRWQVSEPLPLGILAEQDLQELVAELEDGFRRQVTARQVDLDQDRAILVGLQESGQSYEDLMDGLAELSRLVESAGGQVLQALWQRREGPNSATVIGSGKVQELALLVQDLGANLVVFDRELTPSQVRTLEEAVGVRVVDRSEVILDIFAQRARTRAGKLQVELAQLQYLLPRLAGRGRTMSRLGGGIGTRGPGETQLEMERRAIQRRISKLRQEVEELRRHRQRLRQRREASQIPVVALVGYTNAGKSTLLNALTHAQVYVADQLFATLDPTTRRLELPDQQAVLLTDTVGFLTELPDQLVDAFQATLEEVTEADALLHVVDLSHPNWEGQIEAVETLLDKLPLATGPRQLVFNKIDRLDPEWVEDVRLLYPKALFVSATTGQNLDQLHHTLAQFAAVLSPNPFDSQEPKDP